MADRHCALLAVLALALAGCHRSNPIVGDWYGDLPNKLSPSDRSEYTIRNDGTFTTTDSVATSTITVKGTYAYDDSTHTLTILTATSTVATNGRMVLGPMTSKFPPAKRNVTWKSPDELVISAPGEPVTRTYMRKTHR